ncbi:ribokinase [Microbacterium esteraromaticum]|uniref:ribokinase n=1 Tax=Microbacterium esteraromaticum TaxID=57043 RepID=UPI0021BD57B7|nr:ribokinase [Microbacterium esteraromaticum]
MGGKVIVVGALNVDITLAMDRIPVVGETVIASQVSRSSGGKGANQAYAAARTARTAEVAMVGAVGADEAGDAQCAELGRAGVDVSRVRRVAEPTGLAMIAVDIAGGNIIVVAPGANAAPIDRRTLEFRTSDVVVLQLEIPFEQVRQVAKHARSAGAYIVLNAAPAHASAKALFAVVDLLVLNELEAVQLLDVDVASSAELSAAAAREKVDIIVTRGGNSILMAFGSDGSVAEVPTHQVAVVDTVGAGDAFVGTLAAALAEGHTLNDAVSRACAASAATVTVHGARHPELSESLIERMALAAATPKRMPQLNPTIAKEHS